MYWNSWLCAGTAVAVCGYVALTRAVCPSDSPLDTSVGQSASVNATLVSCFHRKLIVGEYDGVSVAC